MELKKTIKERFQQIYPEKRILAVHLNGFSHSVIFDSGSKEDEVESEAFSAYAPEQDWSKKAKELFKDIGHHNYQNNAKEILYISPNKR